MTTTFGDGRGCDLLRLVSPVYHCLDFLGERLRRVISGRNVANFVE